MDESFCGKIKDRRIRDDCYSLLAFNKRDESICQKIAPTKHMDIGRDLCYGMLANVKEDISICELAENPMSKEACILGIEKESLGGTTITTPVTNTTVQTS